MPLLICGHHTDEEASCIYMQNRIEQLEDAIDLVIEELSAQGIGKELVGNETLVQFLERVLKAK